MMPMTQIPVLMKKMMRVRVIYKILLKLNRTLAHILQSIGQIQVLYQEMSFRSREQALQDSQRLLDKCPRCRMKCQLFAVMSLILHQGSRICCAKLIMVHCKDLVVLHVVAHTIWLKNVRLDYQEIHRRGLFDSQPKANGTKM